VTREADVARLRAMVMGAKPVPASSAIRDWFDAVALPTLKAQALSELCRRDHFPPRLIGYMEDGGTVPVDVADAMGGTFGDARTKNAAAFVHKLTALLPGCKASVLCVETWALSATPAEPLDSIAKHPDREEAVMVNMLHHDHKTGGLMQLVALLKVIKVLSANPTATTWAGTKFGECSIVDPMATAGRFSGRFTVRDA